MDIPLVSLGKLISECWVKAELATARSVAEKYHSPDEEILTFLFAAELRATVSEASKNSRVTRAFLTDLRRAVHTLSSGVEQKYMGLIARVNFHNRQHEGRKSASDLGIAIKRPQLSSDHSHLKLNLEFATGLLAQAKLGRSLNSREGTYRWDDLTNPQKKLFRERRDYYSLLLYRLSGESNNQLRHFGWQLCEGHTARQVQAWLHSDAFPKEICSSEIINQVFAGKIGTQNPKIIQTIIDPDAPAARTIELQIFWPGRTPPPSYRLQSHTQKLQRLHLYQHV